MEGGCACGALRYRLTSEPLFIHCCHCLSCQRTLDEPRGVEPDVHIFTRSKVPWVTLPDGVPAVEVFYDIEELWPRESLERIGR